MLMILARLVRSESFWAVAKVRSPHTGPEFGYPRNSTWGRACSGAEKDLIHGATKSTVCHGGRHQVLMERSSRGAAAKVLQCRGPMMYLIPGPVCGERTLATAQKLSERTNRARIISICPLHNIVGV